MVSWIGYIFTLLSKHRSTTTTVNPLLSPPPPGGGAFLFLSPFERRGGLFILEKTMVSVSGGSRPGDNGGPGHPDPEIKWGGPVWKKIFSALWASVWSKNKKGARPPPPSRAPHLDPTLSVLHKELELESSNTRSFRSCSQRSELIPNFQLVNRPSRISPQEVLQSWLINTVYHLLSKNN